ncbi:MAG: DUF2608 domain-containing protein [Chlamydiae bacterium]|nr:DUF2608 domain-containing protein [Chlamydiota bacterium]
MQKRGNLVIGLTARYIEMAYPTVYQLQLIGIRFSLSVLSGLMFFSYSFKFTSVNIYSQRSSI